MPKMEIKMKKISIILIPIAAVLMSLALSVTAYADEHIEYTLKEEHGGYTLSSDEGQITSSSLTCLLPTLKNGSSLTLDGIRINEPISFDGRITVRGSAVTECDITVRYASDIAFDGLELSFSNQSSLRLMGGSLTVNSGRLISDSSTVVVIDDVSSVFMLNGGVVETSSGASALYIKKGSAVLNGGGINNPSGSAVESEGSVTLGKAVSFLSGAYDIITKEPIVAASEGGSFGGSVRIKYLSTFVKGTLSPVILRADPSLASRVELYDANSKKEELVFMESHEGISHKCFLGVYKPFSVRFMCDGTLAGQVDVLSGERIQLPDIPERKGYLPNGWRISVGAAGEYNPSEEITKDTVLYASYKLAPPEFTLRSVELEYDGKRHYLGFENLAHPLSDIGFFTYSWIDEAGKTVSKTANMPFTTVSQSGKYYCILTFHCGQDIATVTTPPVSVTVCKKEITPPVIPSKIYNGREQAPEIKESLHYTFSEEKFTSAGCYYITLTLLDDENYKFKGAHDTFCTVPFEILPADNEWLSEIEIYDVYYGAEISPKAQSRFGKPVFEYSYYPDRDFATSPILHPGTYYVRARVPATADYRELVGDAVSYTVKNDYPISLGVKNAPFTAEYRAFEYFNTSGLEFTVTYSSGAEATVSGDKVSISYQKDKCFRFGDTAVIAEYMDTLTYVAVSVLPAEYDLELTLDDVSYTFDGKFKSYPFSHSLPTGLDGISLRAEVTGGGSVVGEYDVTVSFYTDSLDYLPPKPLSAKLIIAPLVRDVIWGELVFTYDGSVKEPTAAFRDCYGALIPLAVTGGAVAAGEGYIATALGADSNYVLNGTTVEYTVLKAVYDMSGVYWIGSGEVYDGSIKTVALKGLPIGVSVIGYSDNTHTEAGVYTASVSFSYDNLNYEPPIVPDYTWEIKQARYDMSGFGFSGGEYVYDGNAKFPFKTGSVPIGTDGSSPGFTFSHGVTNTYDSPYVIVRFYSPSTNYLPPDDVVVEITLRPKGINVTWSDLVTTYSGARLTANATAAECGITVSGGGINAGKYTVYASANDPNYTVINETAELLIEKAPNSWVIPLSASDVYYGSPMCASAVPLSGSAEYIFYSDNALTNEVTPREVGVYYVVARVQEGTNHLPLTSSAVQFKVMEVLPISISVSVTKSGICAFYKLRAEDFTVTASYNNGTKGEVNSTEVTVSYLGGGTLLAGDNTVLFDYMGVSSTLTVNASRAKLDLSSAGWEMTEFTYDGSVKEPRLVGLPLGVSVVRLYGTGKDAGEYSVTAELDYDKANYEPPILPPCTVVIKKQSVSPTVLSEAVYNGREQLPDYPTGIYKAKLSSGYKNAGEYTVEFVLLDSKNYCFEGDPTAEFVILPRKATVSLNDIRVFLFEDPQGNGFTVTDGSVIDGDDLSLCYLYDGEVLRAKGSNPNYELTVKDGKISYVPRPSPEVARALMLCLLFVVILALLLIVGIRRKERIFTLLLEIGGRPRELAAPKEALGAPAALYTPEDGAVSRERADELISNSVARTLIRRNDERIYTSGHRHAVVNIDTLSSEFEAGATVDINILKERGIIPKDARSYKVLARGVIDKPLIILANSFSISSVKMIALKGGEAKRTASGKIKDKEKKNK